ncbi:MAG: acyl carrier protein [Gammaproteobacteria bacterium]|nr:acyl carrier protein [Gammaproteobacteria bacterium]
MHPGYDEVLVRLKDHLQKVAGKGKQFSDDTDLVSQLGLDSVKVLDLIMEVEDEFDISIPMNVLTEVHTVRDLAEAIAQLRSRH